MKTISSKWQHFLFNFGLDNGLAPCVQKNCLKQNYFIADLTQRIFSIDIWFKTLLSSSKATKSVTASVISVITTYRFQSIYSSFHLPNTDMTIICENWNVLVPVSYTLTCICPSRFPKYIPPASVTECMLCTTTEPPYNTIIFCSPKLFIMMTPSNGNIFRVTGLLCGEFTGHRSIPLTKATTADFDDFLSAPEQMVE